MKLPRNTFCGQTNRREFIHNIGGGFASTALTGMLASDGFFNNANAVTGNPLFPKPQMMPAKAKSVIFLFMYGGPSHVDTFDHKPELYPLDGKTKVAVFPQDRPSVIIMLGIGAERWLDVDSPGLGLRATRHKVRMDPGGRRAWYGTMHLVPPPGGSVRNGGSIDAGDEEGGEKHDLTPGARHADDERQEMWLRRGSIERGDASPLAAMVSCQYPPEASLNEGSINEGEGSLRWPGACLERGHMDKTPIKSCAQEFSAEGARMQEAIEADGPSAAEGCQIMVHDGDTESDSESDTDEIGLKWDAEIRKGSEVQTASITIGTVVGDVSAGMWLHDAASDTGGARFVSFADLDSKMSHARGGSQVASLTAAEEGLESPHMREPAVLLRLESPRTGPTNPALDPYPSDAQAPAQAEDGIAVKSWLREEMDVDLLEQVETQASGSNDAGEKGNRWSGAGQERTEELESSDRSALLMMRTASELSCTAAVATLLQDAETTGGVVKRQERNLGRAPLLIRSPGLRRKARPLS